MAESKRVGWEPSDFLPQTFSEQNSSSRSYESTFQPGDDTSSGSKPQLLPASTWIGMKRPFAYDRYDPSLLSPTIPGRRVMGGSGHGNHDEDEISHIYGSMKPEPLYISQQEVIESKASKVGKLEAVRQAADEEWLFIKQRYPDRSKDWQRYSVESSIWHQYFKDEHFPGIEPLRIYNSGADRIERIEAHMVLNTDVLGYRSFNGPVPVQTSYHSVEGLMEEKVTDMGGIPMRRRFFQYLQKMRDQSKIEHPHCSNSYRQWLAESRVWDQFFDSEVFPSAEPLEEHSSSCITYGPDLFSKTKEQKEKRKQKPEFEMQFPISAEDELTLIHHFGVPFKEQLIGFHQSILNKPGENPSDLGFLLTCPLVYKEIRTRIHHDIHRIFKSRLDTSVILESKIIKISANPNFITNSSVEIGRPLIGTGMSWRKVSDALRFELKMLLDITDDDIDSMERFAMEHGNHRLVLDEETGGIIRLGELLERTRTRALRAGSKRKTDDYSLDKERGEKKYRL